MQCDKKEAGSVAEDNTGWMGKQGVFWSEKSCFWSFSCCIDGPTGEIATDEETKPWSLLHDKSKEYRHWLAIWPIFFAEKVKARKQIQGKSCLQRNKKMCWRSGSKRFVGKNLTRFSLQMHSLLAWVELWEVGRKNWWQWENLTFDLVLWRIEKMTLILNFVVIYSVWMSESLDVWKFECLKVWTFECLKVWLSESLDAWKSECRQSTNRHSSCSTL